MPNSKSLLKIISILSVFVLTLFGAQYFLYSEIKTKNEKIGDMQNNLDLQENRQDFLISMQSTFESLSSDIAKIDDSIISADSSVQFIGYLESLAKDNGVKSDITNLSFDEGGLSESSGLTKFKIRINTDGSWKSTYTFLVQLESLSKRVRINNFSTKHSVSVDESNKSVSSWQSSFDIVVLKYK